MTGIILLSILLIIFVAWAVYNLINKPVQHPTAPEIMVEVRAELRKGFEPVVAKVEPFLDRFAQCLDRAHNWIRSMTRRGER